MSDTIDATAQPATRLEPVAALHGVGANLRVPARDYVRLGQGFYFVFWGLLLTVLTGAQLLMPIDMPPFAESFLGVGVLATLLGSWRLYQVRSLGKSWRQRVGQAFALAMLMAYFCVFFYWWRRVPLSAYLLGNVLAFAATGIVYVIGNVNRPGGFVTQNEGEISLLQAIAMAAGVTGTACLDRTKLIRKTSAGYVEIPVPLKEILKGRERDLRIMAEDILYVPNSAGKSLLYRGLPSIVQSAGSALIYRLY